MDEETFEKSHVPRYEFRNGGARYNLDSCYWRELKVSPTAAQGFLRVVDQEYTVLRKSIFTLGVSKILNGMAALYSYNIMTENDKECVINSETNIPASRTNYGLITVNSRICAFGGKGAQRYSNEIQSFCLYTNMWLPVVKEANGPSPRIPHIFSIIKHDFIIVFGGRDDENVFEDAYAIIEDAWLPLALADKQNAQTLASLEGINYCSISGVVYAFGGKRGNLYSNDIFVLGLNDDLKTLSIWRIEGAGRKNWPCGRAFHGLERLGDNCFAVAGGQLEGKALRDVSAYNIKTGQWHLLMPNNGPILALSPIRMTFENHSLYILGVDKISNSERQVILQLRFNQFQLIKSQICTSCVRRLENKEKEELHHPKKPFVSNGLIYNMALQITSPFQAIQLITDCAHALSATEFLINSFETKSKLSYLDIRFDGVPLKRDQFASVISHSYKDDPVVQQIIDKLKLGAFRLGKTFLFICVDGDRRRVFLLSADSLIISHYDEIYEYFAFEERVSDEYVFTQEGIMHKKFILNQLQSFIDKPKETLNSVRQYGLIIFDNNVVMTTEKTYYAEMIPVENDMQLCKNSKKIQFLSKLGFQLEKDPEVSLASFLRLSYLQNRLRNIEIQGVKIPIEQHSYSKDLQKMENNKEIKKIYSGELRVKNIVAECQLYEVLSEQYVPRAKGIFVYHKGRLINRLDIQFGDLFWQKFFRVKYKKAFSLWSHVGIINILDGAELKTTQTSYKTGSFGLLSRHIKKNYLFPSKQGELASSVENKPNPENAESKQKEVVPE